MKDERVKAASRKVATSGLSVPSLVHQGSGLTTRITRSRSRPKRRFYGAKLGNTADAVGYASLRSTRRSPKPTPPSRPSARSGTESPAASDPGGAGQPHGCAELRSNSSPSVGRRTHAVTGSRVRYYTGPPTSLLPCAQAQGGGTTRRHFGPEPKSPTTSPRPSAREVSRKRTDREAPR